MTEDVFELVGTDVAGMFRVEAVVAEGGFGVVYRAHHAGFDAKVALKCLKIPQHMDERRRAHFREQFRAEAQLLFKLSAALPNVVRPLHIDAISLANGRFMPFMALEWLEGETLDTLVARRGNLGPLEDLVELLAPAAHVLEVAHHFPGADGPISIVHRDLKPENLFLAEVAGQRVLKVLDFGIGKAKSVATQAVGRVSAEAAPFSSFTPAYGAPEQWAPQQFGQTGPWTDVFGLVLTMVELLVGRPILDGDAAAMRAAALDPARRPTPNRNGASVSREVEAVFERALAVDPRERHRDVGEFWRALCEAANVHTQQTVVRAADLAPEGGVRISNGELIFGEPSSPPPSLELASVPPLVNGPVPVGPPRLGAEYARQDAARGGAGANTHEAFDDLGDAPVRLPALPLRPRGATYAAWVLPASAVFAGVLLALLGQYHAAVSGRVFSLGPVGLGWVTVPLVGFGLFGLVARVFQHRGSIDRHS